MVWPINSCHMVQVLVTLLDFDVVYHAYFSLRSCQHHLGSVCSIQHFTLIAQWNWLYILSFTWNWTIGHYFSHIRTKSLEPILCSRPHMHECKNFAIPFSLMSYLWSDQSGSTKMWEIGLIFCLKNKSLALSEVFPCFCWDILIIIQ